MPSIVNCSDVFANRFMHKTAIRSQKLQLQHKQEVDSKLLALDTKIENISAILLEKLSQIDAKLTTVAECQSKSAASTRQAGEHNNGLPVGSGWNVVAEAVNGGNDSFLSRLGQLSPRRQESR